MLPDRLITKTINILNPENDVIYTCVEYVEFNSTSKERINTYNPVATKYYIHCQFYGFAPKNLNTWKT